MSLLEVIQLVGYSVGAVLPLWMSALLARQRRRLEKVERVLLALALALGLWHASNLFLTLHRLLGLDPARWSVALKAADTVAVASVTLCYSFLLHVHLHLWARARSRPLTKFERVRVRLSYIPAVFLVIAIRAVWLGAYAPMLEKLSFFVLPFGLWASYVLALIAGTDFLIGRLSPPSRERRLMYTLAASFVGIGALLLAAYAFGVGRGTQVGLYLQTFGNLGSLLPTALIAYYIYRYRYLELVIRESLVVATFAAIVLVVYLYGIRTLAAWLTLRYGLRAGVIETLLVLAFALVFAPLRAWLERRFHRLFEREAALYREVVARVGAQGGRFQRLTELLRFVEERTAQELGLRRVRFHTRTGAATASDNAEAGADGFEGNGSQETHRDWEESLLELARALGTAVVEGGATLSAHGFEAAYVLRRDEELLGLMLIDAAPGVLTADVRSVLEVLAGQVAIALEDHRLMDENLQLERRLAQGERLSALGRMAATIAHEVKNPLSAIKSIAQVMREDERVAAEYGRDLELIVGEAERLSRSVTQLLSFARQPPQTDATATAGELTRRIAELFRAQAQAKGVQLACRAGAEEQLAPPCVTALSDALSNLLLNAIQATPAGGAVTLELKRVGDRLDWCVADSGAGVSAELRDKIWEPFFTTKQRGTGLGLAIARKRVAEVGGEVVLAPSASGEGARFELRLPVESCARV